LGLNQAISWLGGLQGFSKMYVELDCKQVVDDILKNLNDQTEVGFISNVCRSTLGFFSNF